MKYEQIIQNIKLYIIRDRVVGLNLNLEME
jgi:hypothetical protein